MTPQSTASRSARLPLRFTVVTAIYNAEAYLDQFFSSLVEQSIGLAEHLEVIAVDDGSDDRSAKVVRRWQRKYPNNIRYLHKPNGGPASARNLGLEEASGEWLTFIDADDFVAKDYFECVAAALAQDRDAQLAMISCNYILYDERSEAVADAHPLRFRFAQGERRVLVNDMRRDMQVTVNSAFFRRDLIDAAGLRFDERIRPGFEDTHFAARYLLRARQTSLLFLPAAKYFHRRRADGGSLQDNARRQPEQYADELKYGYIALLAEARGEDGKVPVWIQNTIIFCLSFAFLNVVEQPDTVDFLTEEQRREYHALLVETFASIETSVLLEYNFYYFPYGYRLGIVLALKNGDPYPMGEITDFDGDKNLARLLFWTATATPAVTLLHGPDPIAPAFTKRRRFDFLGEPLAWEHIYWVQPGGSDAPLRLIVDSREAGINVRGSRYVAGVPESAVRRGLLRPTPKESFLPRATRAVREAARSPAIAARYADAWLFMDRDTEADDSAEHLYRYVREQRPDINAFFVVRRASRDWSRFADEGHRRLAFSEPEHVLALLNASHLLSSHLDKYVWGYLDEASFGDMLRYKFIWLQHGVTQGDYSHLINFAPIDCLITSTFAEFESIVADPSPYRATRKETVLTGLPRHDVLLAGAGADAKTIVIMPTWRLPLAGPAVGPGNARSINPQFYESEYARQWKSLLHSPRLAAAAERGGYRVVFIPHPNVEPYIDFFDVPPGTEVRLFSKGRSLQSVFQQLSLFITDFSSKAFDIAYLYKPVIYYQFDAHTFFAGDHLGQYGYFDYERDGFGPVHSSEANLLAAIDQFVDGVAPNAIYRERAARTFAFRDGRSRERVLQAVLELSRPGA